MQMVDSVAISSFARMAEVPRKTLIFYDRIGLFKPAHVADNGYRYYHRNQLDTIGVIQALKELGMPLTEIKNHLDNRTVASTLELLRTQEELVEQQIAKWTKVKRMLAQRAANIELVMGTDIGKLAVVWQQAVPLMLSDRVYEHKSSLMEELWLDFHEQLRMEKIPPGTPLGVVVPKRDLLESSGDRITHMFVRTETACHEQRYLPQGHYLVCYAKADYGDTDKIYPPIFACIERNGLEIVGDAYEEYMLDEVVLPDPAEYLVRVMVQIAKPEHELVL